MAEIDLNVVSKARNALVSTLPPSADVAWFVDSDILLPSNAGILLDYIQQHPVVSGLYVNRRFPHFPQVYAKASPDPLAFAYYPLVTLPTEPSLVDAVGAGCLLIRREALIEMEEKHEAWKDRVRAWVGENDPGPDVRRAIGLGTLLCPHFEFLEQGGEDFYFCAMLDHYLNVRPLLVPEVECKHLTEVPIGLEHFRQTVAAGVVHMGGLHADSSDPAHSGQAVVRIDHLREPPGG